MFFSTVAVIAALAASVSAHMEMSSPPPLTGKGNSKNTATNYDLMAPMSSDTYPCNVPSFDSYISGAGGAAVASWAAGSTQSYTISGSAVHGGGSCQAVLSEDKGKNWRVIKNFIGGCPTSGGSLSFTVPKETKSGDVLFGWTWFNQIGNREMYMNCAAITVTGGGSGFTSGEPMYVANVPGKSTCTTKEGTDPDFTDASCKTGASGGASSGSTPSQGGSSSSGSTTTAPATPTKSAAASASSAPAAGSGSDSGSSSGSGKGKGKGEATTGGDEAAAAPAPSAPATGSGSGSSSSGSGSSGSGSGDNGLWWPGKYDKQGGSNAGSGAPKAKSVGGGRHYGKDAKRSVINRIRGMKRGILGGEA